MLSQDESDLTGKAIKYKILRGSFSTKALYMQINNGDIDLDSEYQREAVWPEFKQIGLIDSIILNIWVPPVVFAVNTLDDGTKTRTLVDGKQRLTSIFRFMKGLIPYKDRLTGDKWWYCDNPAHQTPATKKILSETDRNVFDGRALVCIEYQDLQDADEHKVLQQNWVHSLL
ncbi:hypothetical protein B0H13DRAFT_2312427 [Mycena leptocephala]|nr:hypothetical protein B0H13DRAFT_2312427 [Mycena leptocephala]